MKISLVKGRLWAGTVRVRGRLAPFGSVHDFHIKVRPESHYPVLYHEREVARWAKGRLPVPEFTFCAVIHPICFLASLTQEGVTGHGLIDTLGPSRAVRSLVEAQKLISGVYVLDAPEPSIPSRESEALPQLRKRYALGLLHPDHMKCRLSELADRLRGDHCGPGRPVLVHGDLFLQNLLFRADGRLAAVLDLGAARPGCRMIDIAVLSWAVEISLGAQWSKMLLRGLGIGEAEEEHLLYHRLLFDAASSSADPWSWTATPSVERRKILASQWSSPE